MQLKFISFGVLVGIVFGLVVSFLSPDLLNQVVEFNKLFNQASGYPKATYIITYGSIYNVLPGVFSLFGLIGGLVGFIIYKIFDKHD